MLKLTQEHLCYNSFLTGERRRDRRPSHFLPLLTTIIQLWVEKAIVACIFPTHPSFLHP
jgi:hypothetical protein